MSQALRTWAVRRCYTPALSTLITGAACAGGTESSNMIAFTKTPWSRRESTRRPDRVGGASPNRTTLSALPEPAASPGSG
jgi:hypothetical protein